LSSSQQQQQKNNSQQQQQKKKKNHQIVSSSIAGCHFGSVGVVLSSKQRHWVQYLLAHSAHS